MKSLQIAALAATIFNVALTLIVLRSQSRARTSFPYAVWGISLTLWNLGVFFLSDDTLPRDGQWFWELTLHAGVIFLPLSLLHFCAAITGRAFSRWWLLLYLVHAAFFASLFNGGFISDVRHYAFGFWGVPGPVFWVYLIFYSAESYGIIFTLRRARQKAGPTEHIHLTLMLAATFLMIVAGANDLLPIIGYDHYPGIGLPFIPFGNLAAVLYAIIIAYSLLQHQFLNVHVSLSRATAQAVRLIFVFLIALILQLLIATFAPVEFSTFHFVATLFTILASSIIASLVFPRLFGKGDDTLERRILGDRFEYQDRVRGFIESMSWYNDLDPLLDDLQDLMVKTFRISSFRIILRDETRQVFSVFRTFPVEPLEDLPELKVQSPIFQYFEWGKSEYLVVNAKYARPGERPIERLAREQLASFQAEFCFPLASQNEPFGLFLVGAKTEGTAFTATDINLLVSLLKNMSLMVNQIRLKSQILQAQELDLLGRMSRGMAHDLNNLLTPVWTLLELSGESGTGFDEELLPVAHRNIKTMRAYIREALFFSENLRPDLQLGRLDLVIKHAVDLARTSRKKEVDVISVTPGEVVVEMDEVLIQRLIANLISNSIDASKVNAQIHVHLERLPRADDQDWLRVRVVDQGEGIPKENLGRILRPYFTTKNRGDETRGFGLGLAICRKIVHLHGGNLSIASVMKKGTTVQVDLPCRQVRKAAPAVALSA